MGKNMFDDTVIKNIDHTKWFKKMEHYPKTITDFKLLLVYIDSFNLLNQYDLSTIIDMDHKALDSIYLILRVSNSIFNKFCDSCIKEIFMDNIKEIFQVFDTNDFLSAQDQFYQDMYYFISNCIKNNNINLDEIHINTQLKNFFNDLFNNIFYHSLFKNLQFRESKIAFLSGKSTDFIKYANINLLGVYKNMKLLCDMIFYQNNYNLSYLESIVDLNEISQENEELRIFYEEQSNLIFYDHNKLLKETIAINI